MSEFPPYSSVEAKQTATEHKCNCDLLTWRDPVKTGKVFAGLVFSLILVKYVNLLSLFFRLATYALLASGAAELSGKLVTGRGFVARFKPEDLSDKVSTKVLDCSEILKKRLPDFEKEVQKIFYAEDIEKTFKVCALTYILFKITSFFNLYRLLFGSTILTFTIPYVYDRYHTEATRIIQEFLKEATLKVKEQLQVIQEKSTPFLEKAQDKLGPVSQFIHSKYQTRTATSTVDASPESQQDDFITENATTLADGFATTSGARVQQNEAVTDSIDSTTEFPTVPETTPLVQTASPSIVEVERAASELNSKIAN